MRQHGIKTRSWGESLKGRKLTVTEKMKTHLIEARKSRKMKPNKIEQKLDYLLQERGLPFKYVGGGEVIIGGRMPDFININGVKQVIELFGDYWHSPLLRPNTKYSVTYDGVRKHYHKYGFDTLIVWEGELANKDALVDKIASWAKGNMVRTP